MRHSVHSGAHTCSLITAAASIQHNHDLLGRNQAAVAVVNCCRHEQGSMGNSQSAAVGLPGEMPLSLAGTADTLQRAPPITGGAVVAGNREHELVGIDGQRIIVDIRGADLDDDAYQVWVRRHPVPQYHSPGVASQVAVTNALVQGLLGTIISVLSIAKLVDEIRLLRSLRRELGSLSGSISGLGSAPGLPGSMNPTAGHAFTPASDSVTGVAASKAQDAGSGPAVPRTLVEELDLSVPLAITCRKGRSTGVSWASISGLDDVKQLLQEVTVLPSLRPDLFKGVRQPPRGVLLFGPPGAGKTMLARAVASESHAAFFAITGSSVLSMWYGQSEANVKALFEQARSHAPSVIFIDEVDSLLGKRSGGAGGAPGGDAGGTTPDRRLTNEFLAFIDGIQTEAGDARVMVMAATNHPWDLDEAALSRFSRRIYVPLPSREARAHLLSRAMRDMTTTITSEQYLQLADKCAQYSGRDLMVVCREASMRPLRELWGTQLLLTTSGGVQEAGAGQDKSGTTSASGTPGISDHEQALRARVVSLLAGHLRKKQHVKKVRRELSQWCTSLGEDVPAWCQVDALMSDALQQVQAQQQATGTRVATVKNTATAQEQQDGVHTETVKATEVLQLQDHQQQQVVQQTAQQDGIAIDSKERQDSQAGSAVPVSAQQQEQQQAGEADDTAKHALDNNSSRQDQGLAVVRENITTTERGSAPFRDDDSAKCTPREKCKKEQLGRSSCAAQPAMTLQELITLPADSIRPVSVEDFEAALKRIQPSELQLSQQYEEFNQRYGSGADVKRTGPAAYLHMYM